MQKQQIDKLKKDNDRLKEDLALETRQARHVNTMSASAQMAKLQDQCDLYKRKIETERQRIVDLDKAITEMEGRLLKQRSDMGGVNSTHDDTVAVQKNIRILENRLDKALIKFNEALAHNKRLRESIDNLRRERVQFDGIYKKLEKELQEVCVVSLSLSLCGVCVFVCGVCVGVLVLLSESSSLFFAHARSVFFPFDFLRTTQKKKKMADIMEVASAAYQARDRAQAEMLALKEQADKEQINVRFSACVIVSFAYVCSLAWYTYTRQRHIQHTHTRTVRTRVGPAG